jgi:hypothetical protein
VGDLRGADHPGGYEAEFGRDAVEEPDARAQHEGRKVDLEFVQEAVVEELPYGVGATRRAVCCKGE